MRSTAFIALLAMLALAAGPAAAQGSGPNGPVRIGLLLDMSGPYADMTGPGSQTAAMMAAEDFGGTVLGRKIEVLAVDHQNKADLASAKAQEWFGPGNVDAIVEAVGSSAALAVQEIGRKANKIVMFSAPASSTQTVVRPS
ncbi:MAG TPA: ABC transporter substrate-binding protein, partial [Acetobacteraceae bacterium]|nr:ABC transporter substrate-binding protein [Acetobacteraceae bacterium]